MKEAEKKNRRFTGKRMISLLLLVLMIVNMGMPYTLAFADGEDPAAPETEAAQNSAAEEGNLSQDNAGIAPMSLQSGSATDVTSELYTEIIKVADQEAPNGGSSLVLCQAVKVDPRTVFQAGESVKYLIKFQYAAIPNVYQYYDKPMGVFKQYENSSITIRLPDGLILNGAASGYSWRQNSDGSYTFDVTSPASAQAYSFEVDIYIQGNGTDNAIADYSNLGNNVTFTTSYTLWDQRPDQDKPITPKTTYTQTITASMPGFETDSPDQWGINKSANSVTFDRTSMTATVTYTIDVGFKDATGVVQKGTENYERTGRDKLDGIVLSDVLSDDKNLVLKSATIQKPDGKAVDITSGANNLDLMFAALGTTETNDLALNTTEVDSTGDGTRNTRVGKATQYIVTAVYEIPASLIHNFGEAIEEAEFKNQATLVSQLAKKAQDTDTADASIKEPLPLKDPATLSIQKTLEDYRGAKSYYADEYGEINYTISAGTPFTVFVKTGKTYAAVNASPATKVTNLKPGTTYYLQPGIAYTVAEELTAAQQVVMDVITGTETKSVSAGDDWQVEFANKEKAADVVVIKTDDNGIPLAGATFRLKAVSGTYDLNAVTQSNGTATFTRVPYGDYSLEETAVPYGYAKTGTIPNITVNSNTTVTVTVTNHNTIAMISLTKYLEDAEATQSRRANVAFTGTFALERTTDGSTWETVTTSVSGPIASTVNANGQIVANVPAMDADGKIYTYRFKETLPNTYYDPVNPFASVTYSKQVTLCDTNGTISPTTVNVDMYNREKVIVTVDKHFWTPTQDGKLIENTGNLTAPITLYYYDGANMQKVGTQQAGAGAAAAKWTVPLYNGSAKIDYYVSEDAFSGYTPDPTGGITINGKVYFKIDFNATGAGTQTLNNIQDAVPVRITKENYFTNAYVAGTGVTVTDQSGNVAEDALSKASLKDVAIPAGGVIVYLAPGDYLISETLNTSGMTWVNKDGTPGVPLAVNVAQLTYGGRNTASIQTYTIYNRPDPQISIVKKDSTTGAVITSDYEFTVYTQNSSGVFEPVKNSTGSDFIIQAGQSAEEIPAGTYYLLETKVPGGYLDPSKFPTEYVNKGIGDFIQGTAADGNKYTFLKITIPGDEKVEFTANNVKNEGSLLVVKYVDGQKTTIPGFSVSPVAGGQAAATGLTGTDGTVTFSLPVYDQNGNKIVYTIQENALSAQLAATMYKVFDGQTVTLSVGTTTKTDVNGAEVYVENGTYRRYTVHKVFKHSWEFPYTGKYYDMSGVTVGLYEQQTDGSWNYLKSDVTDAQGYVSFEKLDTDKTYAFVEIDSPDPNMYPYMNENAPDLAFAADANGKPLAVIAAADLAKYNYLISYAETQQQKPTTSGTLYNRDHWVQFDITKYVDNQNTDRSAAGWDAMSHQQHDAGFNRYDNAIFNLYRIDMTGNSTTSIPFPGSGWQLMGTYVSGTKYDSSGNRLAGEFMSGVDQNANENVVYLLVETNAGPGGAKINPNFQFTYYQSQNAAYTVNINLAGAGTPRTGTYVIDSVNRDDILNTPINVGTGIRVANIRIAKWADVQDSSGSHVGYTPLPNVTFGVYLDAACSQELEQMTVGLDNYGSGTNYKAWAQGAPYALKIDKNNMTGELLDYATLNSTGIVVPIVYLGSQGQSDIYGVLVYVKELSAPKGYSYATDALPMYLSFVDEEGVNAFNDAYFVTDIGGVQNVPLAENQQGASCYVTWDQKNQSYSFGSGQYRIVNYPTTLARVRVLKYGFTPDSTMVGMTAEQLDALATLQKLPLSGVKMILQRNENNRWVNWNYRTNLPAAKQSEAEFTTVGGAFNFNNGLAAGSYRIYELDIGSGNANYEMRYPDEDHARYFTVGTTAMEVSLYNPTKTTITLTKKDLSGNPVYDLRFNLGKLYASTDQTGVAVFRNIPSGVYRLTEFQNTVYSTNYLARYVASLPNGPEKTMLSSLIKVGGTLIGYEYDANSDIVIKQIGITGNNINLTVADPNLVSLSLKKEDENGKGLEGAQFQIAYAQFASWSGVTDIRKIAGQILGTFTTDKNGEISGTMLNPGIYRIIETKAPEGYDILKDKNGNTIEYYIVATGGLNVSVIGVPTTAVIVGSDGQDKTITTLVTGDTTARIAAINRPKVTAEVIKTVETGKVSASSLLWAAQFDLYTTDQGGTSLGTATVTSLSGGAVEFTNGGSPVLLSQNTTYYIEETVAASYVPIQVTVNGTPVTAVNNRYPFTVTGDSKVQIAVVNRYLPASVTFKKVDREDHTALLSGASFVVCKADGVTPVPGATVTESTASPGVYTATLLLDAATADVETEYVIVETTAPSGYIVASGAQLKVKLSAKNNVIELSDGAYIENTKGIDLTIQKYADISSASNPTPGKKDTVTFTLYKRDVNSAAKWEVVQDTKIDNNGQVKWLLDPNYQYAFAETSFNSGVYIQLESIWSQGVQANRETITLKDSSTVSDAIVLGTGIKPGTVLDYQVYNTPTVSVKIIKKDVGGYPADVIPKADFVIYELKSALPSDPDAAANVIFSLQNAAPVYTGQTGKQPTGDIDTTAKISWDIWNGRDLTKNYVVAETWVDAYSGGPYDTMNKDDNRVVWYAAINAGDPTDEYVLKNVYSDFDVKISKTVIENSTAKTSADAQDTDNAVVGGHVESLLTGDRKVVYSIKPDILLSKNQPLARFEINEDGISFTGTPTDYEITKVQIGPTTHTPDTFIKTVNDPSVKATISWFANGVKVTDTTVTLSTAASVTVNAPQGKLTTFKVSYYCDDVLTATGNDYALGRNFTAGELTVYATVMQQQDGTASNPITEITKFTNSASVEAEYPKWAPSGQGRSKEIVRDSAAAVIDVNGVELPRVYLNKTAVDYLGGEKTSAYIGAGYNYVLTIENRSHNGQNFVDPVIVDTLPSGVYCTDKNKITVGTGTAKEAFTITSVNIVTGDSVLSTGGVNETALILELSGTLKPGSQVNVTIPVTVSSDAVLYGGTIDNFAYLSSSKHSYHIKDKNPNGYSFTATDGTFPATLDTAANNLGSIAAQREGALKKAIGAYSGTEYGYVTSANQLKLLTKEGITLNKAIRGDQDSAFSSVESFIATATRTKPGQEGWVKYRLTITNGLAQTAKDLAIGDMLPDTSDGRATKWNVVFDQIESIVLDGKPVNSEYDVFYYIGTKRGAALQAELVAAVNVAADYTEPNAQAWAKTKNIPVGWVAASAYSGNKADIKAFIIALQAGKDLDTSKSAMVIYNTKVEAINDDNDFAKVALTNANNDFWCYSTVQSVPSRSNLVSATLMDGNVAVAGDLWIDEDWDGVQENANRRDYFSYAIIQKLISGISFSITDLRTNPASGMTDQGGDNTALGESIKHFSFQSLGYAVQVRNPLYVNNELNRSALKTADPYVYSLTATLDSDLLDIFGISPLGAEHYMSDQPDQLETTLRAHSLDNNFYMSKQKAVAFQTSPFYLTLNPTTDQSKDIGVTMARDLEITKVAESNPSQTLDGAKFRIYGPFDQGKGAVTGSPMTFSQDPSTGHYIPDPAGSITELVTKGGIIYVEGLNWWKEYAIEETQAAPGFVITGATATADPNSGAVVKPFAPGAWILEIPAKSKTVKTDKVTITNPISTGDHFEVVKVVEDPDKANPQYGAGSFSFDLFAVDARQVRTRIQTRAVDAQMRAVFDEIKWTTDGTYHYIIKEVIPANPLPNLTYSTDEIEITVVITTNTATGLMDKTITYSKNGTAIPAATIPAITNIYHADPIEVPLGVKKTIATKPSPLTAYPFTFTITPLTTGAPMPVNPQVTVTGEGTAVFGNIRFTKSGVYEYEIAEQQPTAAQMATTYKGCTFDAHKAKVTITVTGANGKLSAQTVGHDCTITDPIYPGITIAAFEFVNGYQPLPTSIILEAEKILKNLRIVDGMFAFVVKDANGSVIRTAYNDKQGHVSFAPIDFTKTGTYTYEISEVTGVLTRTDYDKSLYTVTVDVTDNNGQLQASVTGITAVKYVNNNPTRIIVPPGTPIEFVNVYNPPVPPTGYGPNYDSLLGTLGAVSLIVLIRMIIGTPKRRRR